MQRGIECARTSQGGTMDLNLRDRVAVVTGASRGIGLSIVRALLAADARVVAGARSATPELTELAEGGRLQIEQVDLANPDAPARLVAAAGDRIDVLVNNVGNAPARTGGFLSVTDQDWLDTLNLNLFAAVRTTRAALPGTLPPGRGPTVANPFRASTLAL